MPTLAPTVRQHILRAERLEQERYTAAIEDHGILKNNKLQRQAEERARRLFQAPLDVHAPVFKEGASWGNNVDNMPLMLQLIHNECVIVDLKPQIRTTEAFIQTYGFTPQQMLRLASEKRICLNLLGYESNKRKGDDFLDYTAFDGSNEEREAYMDLFLVENNLRINSFTSRAFFDARPVRNQPLFADMVKKTTDALEKGLRKLTDGEREALFVNEVFRKGPPDGIITTLAHQYTSTRMVLALHEDPSLPVLADDISEYLLTNESILDFALMVRRLKVTIISPVLACFGGVYYMSNHSFASLLETPPARDGHEDPRLRWPLSNKAYLAIYKALYEKRANVGEEWWLCPPYMNNKRFDEFLGFLDDLKSNQRSFRGAIRSLAEHPELDEARIRVMHDYLAQNRTIFEKWNAVSSKIGTATSIAVKFGAAVLAGHDLGADMEMSDKLVKLSGDVLLGFGPEIFGVIRKPLLGKKDIDRALGRLMNGHSYQLMVDLQKIRSIAVPMKV